MKFSSVRDRRQLDLLMLAHQRFNALLGFAKNLATLL